MLRLDDWKITNVMALNIPYLPHHEFHNDMYGGILENYPALQHYTAARVQD
jgi:hypothetical protein